MTAINLGAVPLSLKVNLTEGADFVQEIHTASGDPWPDGTEITLELYAQNGTLLETWPATIDADYARWNVDKADVDALIADKPKRAALLYVNGTADATWARGSVSVRGW